MGSLKENGLFVTLKTGKDLMDRLERDNNGLPEQMAAVSLASAYTWNPCAYLTRHDMELPEPPQSDGKIIAVVPCSHPDDYKFLQYVLVEYPNKFVSWLHNSQDGGFHHGHYFELEYDQEGTEQEMEELRTKALKAFAKRVEERV